MVLKSVGVFSVGKVLGVLYAGVGLIAGLFFSLFSIVGATAGAFQGESGGALLGFLFGIGAVIVLPFIYGTMGFLGGLVMALLYNLVASVIGGVEVELQ